MNQNQSFSAILQELSKSYYNYKMSFEQYRSERRIVLDNIDRHFNHKIWDGFSGSESGNEMDSHELTGANMQDSQSSVDHGVRLGQTMTFSIQDIQDADKKNT